jgi:prepilin-type processing-associated H-X9-DG protein
MVSFRVLLQPYVKNKQVFICPSASELNTYATTDWEKLGYDHGKGLPGNRHLTSGYAMNRVHWDPGNRWDTKGPNPSTGDNFSVPDASIVAPAECILIMDSTNGTGLATDGWYSVHYQFNAPGFVRGVNPQFYYNKTQRDKGCCLHSGGASYIFVDGHAKWHRPEQIPCTQEKCWWAVENRHP